MHIAATILLATSLLTSGAWAAESGPLPSGKPVGVRQAQVENSNIPWLWIGAGALALGFALTVGSGSGGVSPTATSTAAP